MKKPTTKIGFVRQSWLLLALLCFIVSPWRSFQFAKRRLRLNRQKPPLSRGSIAVGAGC
jgi:hypothetical protein